MRKILVVCCFALVAVALVGCGLEGWDADEGTGSDILVADEGMDTATPEEDVVVVDEGQQDMSGPDEGTDTMVPEVCVPNCSGKACGDDGCGGECGACPVIPCTTETCDRVGGSCSYKLISCDDGNPCTVEHCDPVAMACQYDEVFCNDGNPCTVDTCDSNIGCVHSPISCDDSNKCTIDSCNSATGDCEFDPIVCDDGKDYTADSCNPETGGCEFVTPKGTCLKDSDCSDGNSCTQDVCDSITHQCKLVEVVCDFGDPCSTERCVPSVVEVLGYICVPDTYTDCDDGSICTMDWCDPDTGACVHNNILGCCETDAQCGGNEFCDEGWCQELDCDSAPECWTVETIEHECVFNPATEGTPCVGGYCDGLGACQPPVTDCDDGDKYTEDIKDPVTGECQHTELMFTVTCTVPTSLVADGRVCEVWFGYGFGAQDIFLLKENQEGVPARTVCGSSWTPSQSEMNVRVFGPGADEGPWQGGAYAHLTDPDGNAVALAEVDHSWSKPNNWATPTTGIPWCQK